MAKVSNKATRKNWSKKSKAATHAKSPGASTSKKGSDGSISSGIYDAVEKLVAGGKMKRAAAFRELAKQTGRKEGTISVNYYYAAKKRGVKMRKRGGRKVTVAPRRNGRPSKIEALLESLAELIREQAEKLDSLRQENQRFATIRQLIGR